MQIFFFHDWFNKLFSEEKKIHPTQFNARKSGRVRHIKTK